MTPLRWTTLVLCAVALYVLLPLWPPLVLAAWTAALTRPLLLRFERRLKGRRRAAAALSLLLFVVLAAPVTLVTIGIFTGAQELVATVQASPSATKALEVLISTPDAPLHLPATVGDVVSLVERAGTQGLGLLTGVAGAAARGLVGLLLYFAFAYALLLDSPTAWAWIQRSAPLEPRHLRRLAGAFNETGRGLLVGVGLTAVTQGVLATVIYVSLGVPRAWVLGPITGLASIIPLAGTSLVWGPIALGLFLTERPIRALVLVLLGLLVISSIDNVLRPLFARLGALQLPIAVVFASAFGGLMAFGPWGALLGPLLVRLSIEALALAKEEASAKEETSAEPRPPG